jgi:hypothetical protein
MTLMAATACIAFMLPMMAYGESFSFAVNEVMWDFPEGPAKRATIIAAQCIFMAIICIISILTVWPMHYIMSSRPTIAWNGWWL